jgi:subtilase family serine protease
MTTTLQPITKIQNRCLTEKKFTHIMCDNKCMRISNFCRNSSNALSCSDQFHLNCKQTQDRSQYICKCYNHEERCIAMLENCDDYEHCEQVCQDSIDQAESKLNQQSVSSSMTWIILAIVILLILLIAIIMMTLRYRRRSKNAKKAQGQSRTPAAPEIAVNNSRSTDARQQLLNGASNTANETS